MYLFFGVLVLSLVVLCWCIALILCRRTRNLAGMGKKTCRPSSGRLCAPPDRFSACSSYKNPWPHSPPSALEVGLSLITIAITVIIYRILKVRLGMDASHRKAISRGPSPVPRAS